VTKMKAMFTGFVAIVVIGVGAYFVLNDVVPMSSKQVYQSPNAAPD
tara:strand:+ start:466 stop:603 length:138 start_codon:yes stop_codon:yes gene_type:complete